MTVYVDGSLQNATDLHTYNVQSEIVIPNGYELIAIRCENIGGGEGLLASAESYFGELLMLSDSTWKCSTVFEEGWNQKDFRASSDNWENATNIGTKSWSVSGEISQYARWIWTKERANTIYCRTEFPWRGSNYYYVL